MDWKVISINVFYVQLLKVGSCTNDDKSVPKILLSFSASIQMFYFPNLLLLGKPPDFDENCHFFYLCPNNVLEFRFKKKLCHLPINA